MKHRGKSQLGYTAAEMIVVVAIVGLFTLAAIPNFLQMYRSNELRTGARTFASDARWIRMQAIKNQRPTKISFTVNTRNYSMSELTAANVWVNSRERGQTNRQTQLPEGITFESHTFVDIASMPVSSRVPDDSDSLPDLVYMPDGSAYSLTDAEENIVLKTRHTMPKPRFKIEVRPAGNLKTSTY